MRQTRGRCVSMNFERTRRRGEHRVLSGDTLLCQSTGCRSSQTRVPRATGIPCAVLNKPRARRQPYYHRLNMIVRALRTSFPLCSAFSRAQRRRTVDEAAPYGGASDAVSLANRLTMFTHCQVFLHSPVGTAAIDLCVGVACSERNMADGPSCARRCSGKKPVSVRRVPTRSWGDWPHVPVLCSASAQGLQGNRGIKMGYSSREGLTNRARLSQWVSKNQSWKAIALPSSEQEGLSGPPAQPVLENPTLRLRRCARAGLSLGRFGLTRGLASLKFDVRAGYLSIYESIAVQNYDGAGSVPEEHLSRERSEGTSGRLSPSEFQRENGQVLTSTLASIIHPCAARGKNRSGRTTGGVMPVLSLGLSGEQIDVMWSLSAVTCESPPGDVCLISRRLCPRNSGRLM
jgi:hypothetical protein